MAVARRVEDRAELPVDRGTKQPLVGEERTLKQQVIGRVTPIESETFGDEERIERCTERTCDGRQARGRRRLDGEPAVGPDLPRRREPGAGCLAFLGRTRTISLDRTMADTVSFAHSTS